MGKRPPRQCEDLEFESLLEVYANKTAIKCKVCKGKAVVAMDLWVLHSDIGDLRVPAVIAKMYCYDCQSLFYANYDISVLSQNIFQ